MSTRPASSSCLVAASAALLALTACGSEAAPDDTAATAGPSTDVTIAILPDSAEAISLLGDTLWRPVPSAAALPRLTAQLDSAEQAVANEPGSADALIWLGRRQAYLGRYREAISTFGEGVARYPEDARFYRHRGHRFLTTRQLDRAIDDFTRAGELQRGIADALEPDGAPNAAGIPVSTLQFNIWYHLGLSHFLRGDWERALTAYDECLAVSDNADSQVATAYWRYMTLRRLGRDADASASVAFVSDTLTVIENDTYLQLLRLFRGDVTTSDVLPATPEGQMDVANSTLAFGVSMHELLSGRSEQARVLWRQIVAGGQWAAFGSLAAEAELAR